MSTTQFANVREALKDGDKLDAIAEKVLDKTPKEILEAMLMALSIPYADIKDREKYLLKCTAKMKESGEEARLILERTQNVTWELAQKDKTKMDEDEKKKWRDKLDGLDTLIKECEANVQKTQSLFVNKLIRRKTWFNTLVDRFDEWASK